MGHMPHLGNLRPNKPAQEATPRWLRPKLTKDQIDDIGLAHISNLDDISKGRADEQVLWDLVHCVMTWSMVASDMKLGIPEMVEQLNLTTDLVKRYERTGHILFTGPEYTLARKGIAVMDTLAEKVDQHTASACNEAAMQTVNAMSAACALRRQNASAQLQPTERTNRERT